MKILSRVLRWTKDGIEYKADQRHADLLIKEMGLEEDKPVATPIVTANPVEAEEEEDK